MLFYKALIAYHMFSLHCLTLQSVPEPIPNVQNFQSSSIAELINEALKA